MKNFLLILLISTFCYASHQQVYIGTIDKQFIGYISKNQLRIILNEIEKNFELKLGYSVFSYSKTGKPINLIYVEPSEKKKKIHSRQKKSKYIKSEMTKLNEFREVEKVDLSRDKLKLKEAFDIIDNDIAEIDDKVLNSNKKNTLFRAEQVKLKKDIELTKNRINERSISLKKQQTSNSRDKQKLNEEFDIINNDIEELNHKVSNLNNRNTIGKSEHAKFKKNIELEKNRINERSISLKKQQSNYNRRISQFSKKTDKYNTLVDKYNRLQGEIESLSQNLIDVAGVTEGITTVKYESLIQNGNKSTTKKITTTMKKIDIFYIEDIKALKAILAHEIGHLVGVGHINTKGALMHPILQQEQKNKLDLTYDDIQVFNKAFDR